LTENEDTGDDQIQFCTLLELLRSRDNMSVAFKKTRFSMTLDMTAAFFVVSVNTNEELVGVVEENISMFEISACMCQSSFVCDDSSVVVEQGSSVGICLTPSSTDVRIPRFELSMAANGYTYSPITMDGTTQTVDSTTIVTTSVTGVTKITVRLVTGLFQGLSDVVVISGNGVLEFDSSKRLADEGEASKTFQVYISTYSEGCKKTSVYQKLISTLGNIMP